MPYDDDKFGRIWPTRQGAAIGGARERQMLDAIGGSEGFRTRISYNADGSVTELRTKGGMPQFITLPGERAAPEEDHLTPLFAVECPTLSTLWSPTTSTKKVDDVIKYVGYSGATSYGTRTEYTEAAYYADHSLATTWWGSDGRVKHNGLVNQPIYTIVPDGFCAFPFGLLTKAYIAVAHTVTPGESAVAQQWTNYGLGVNGTANNIVFKTKLYADDYPNLPDARSLTSLSTTPYDVSAAFKKKNGLGVSENFVLSIPVTDCGVWGLNAFLRLNCGLPAAAETEFAKLHNLSASSVTPINFPAIPARGFRRFKDSGGVYHYPIFQSFGSLPYWVNVSPNGKKAVAYTVGGYYMQTTYGANDWAAAGVILDIDMDTAVATIKSVDSLYDEKYVTGPAISDFAGAAPAALTSQVDIVLIDYDAAGNDLILSAKSSKAATPGIVGYYLNGVALVTLHPAASAFPGGTSSFAIDLCYAAPREGLYIFAASAAAVYREYEIFVIYGGVKIASFFFSGTTVQTSNAATGAYVLGGTNLALTGTMVPAVTYTDVDGGIQRMYGPHEVAGNTLTLGAPKAIAALNDDKTKLAVSIMSRNKVPVDSGEGTVQPVCFNYVINLADSTALQFGSQDCYYSRLHFEDVP